MSGSDYGDAVYVPDSDVYGLALPITYPGQLPEQLVLEWSAGGRWMDRGIVWTNSSTQGTKTIGAADCLFDTQYLPQVI